MAKTSLRSRVNRFFFKNRDKGVRNLMLYIAVGNVVVYVLTLLNQSNPFFYNLFYFNPVRLLRGEVWRLFTYPLVYLCESGSIFGFISLLFFYWCGKILDNYWGPLRFNLFYLSGVLLTDLVGIAVSLVAVSEMGAISFLFTSIMGIGFVGYVNMSLLLAVATVQPEQEVRLYFFIPVKMKWLAWLDLGITLFEIVRGLISLIGSGVHFVSMYLALLIPVAAIVNYLLFFGKQAADILPDFMRRGRKTARQRNFRQVYGQPTYRQAAPRTQARPGPGRTDNARFRCTVCGRTELTNPGLEFRYCSRCAGYRCYCEDHINNHAHITE